MSTVINVKNNRNCLSEVFEMLTCDVRHIRNFRKLKIYKCKCESKKSINATRNKQIQTNKKNNILI